MSKIRLSQSWIDRATAEDAGEVMVVGLGKSELPSEPELSKAITKAAGVVALREMVRRKWFSKSDESQSKSGSDAALHHFLFGQRHRPMAFATYAMFRRQPRQRDLIEEITTHAWLCHVMDRAVEVEAPSFNSTQLNAKAISHLTRLSARRSGPREAIEHLRKAGVRVVLESSLPGMRMDGASFFLPKVGPVIGLTLRYDRLDNFWFTLLHEVAHIALHLRDKSDTVFVDAIEADEIEPTESEVEAEADAFAKDSFIPRDAWLRSDAFRFGTESAIVALAKKLDIHPAIVAGRLRFERKRFHQYNDLLGAGEVRQLLMAG